MNQTIISGKRQIRVLRRITTNKADEPSSSLQMTFKVIKTIKKVQ